MKWLKEVLYSSLKNNNDELFLSNFPISFEKGFRPLGLLWLPLLRMRQPRVDSKANKPTMKLSDAPRGRDARRCRPARATLPAVKR